MHKFWRSMHDDRERCRFEAHVGRLFICPPGVLLAFLCQLLWWHRPLLIFRMRGRKSALCPRSRRNCNSLRLMFSTRQTSCRRRSALQVMLHRLKSRWTTSPIRLHAKTPPMPCSTRRPSWMLSLLARVLTPPMSQGMSMRQKGLMLHPAVEPKVRSMPPRLLVCLRTRPIVRTFPTKMIPSLKRKARKRQDLRRNLFFQVG